jgi:EthD domain
MYRIFAFLTKRDDVSMSAFKEYYENNHIPLILSLAPSPVIYKRRYLDRDEKFTEYPYPAKAGSPTVAGKRLTRAAPAGMAPALSWS